jgi:dihydroorotase
MYNLLFRNGKVLDPGGGLNGLYDVAVAKGEIAHIALHINPEEAAHVIDVAGKLVTPGLIDMHTHVAWGMGVPGVTEECLHPDMGGVMAGVTTLIDAGSTGAYNFGGFVNCTLPSSHTRVLPFLHMDRTGLMAMPDHPHRQSIDLEATIKTVEAYKSLVLGIKFRMVSPGMDNMGLDLPGLSVKASRETGTRIMVHIGDTNIPPSGDNAPRLTWQMLEMMVPGDIITHIYTANPGGMLDGKGKVVPQLKEARERGVVLDAAHGRSNFSFDVARRLLDQDIVTDVISSDLTARGHAHIVYSLTECMSKFLMLGFTLEQVIDKTTSVPARMLGQSGTLGALAVGREADISVLDIVAGEWLFTDSFGRTEKGDKAIVPVLTVRAGEVFTPDWGPHPWGWLPVQSK